jgi:hypothetical protein
MKHLNNRNNSKVTAATVMAFLTLVAPLLFILLQLPQQLQLAEAKEVESLGIKAPPAISGENVYVAWWTNNTANNNEEIMFRASTDSGETFGDKINLSNTTDADSVDAEIAAEGANVIVTWWERNQTSDIPVARISTDAGETFGPLLMLAANGTISSTEEEGGEAVGGGAEVAE